MLTVFLRATLIYVILLVIMRLMGKRQLGQLQPFELVITLLIAELACIPMAETAIPVSYGLIPIFTLFVLHLFITKISARFIGFRRLLNGKPAVIINNGEIDYKVMKKLDMTTNDLMEGLRNSGYFSPEDVAYAILETNGQLSVMPSAKTAPLTAKTMNVEPASQTLPYTVISEGKLLTGNMKLLKMSDGQLNAVLRENKLDVNDVLLLMLDENGSGFIQSKVGSPISININLGEQ